MPAERTPTKASELRRSTKPIMEKRRRARINNSLSELKNLILDTLAKDNARHSKLEKADILEMTVKHLQQLQRQQRQQAVVGAISDATFGKFKSGYGECASEVSRFLGREGVDPAVRQRLLGHLSNCVSSFGPNTNQYYNSQPASPHQTAMPTTVRPNSASPSLKPVHVQVPTEQTHTSNNNKTNGLELVATRLPTGELVFYMPERNGAPHQQQVTVDTKRRGPVNVLGSSGILSPAASDRSSPSPSSPISLTAPCGGKMPFSPAHYTSEPVWRPW